DRGLLRRDCQSEDDRVEWADGSFRNASLCKRDACDGASGGRGDQRRRDFDRGRRGFRGGDSPIRPGGGDFAHFDGRRGFARVSWGPQPSGRGGPHQQMSHAKRRRVIAGNWKMFKAQAETRAVFGALNPVVTGVTDCDIVIAPTFTSVASAVEATKGTHIAISGQDLYWEKEGAFTGEISAGMLVEAGCRYTLVGHSERRHIFGETDEAVFK